MDNARSLYGGAMLLGVGHTEINILGFNHDENPVTAQVPVVRLLNSLSHHSEQIRHITKASAIYFHSEGNAVHFTVLDDKMKLIHETLPLEKCWTAIEQIIGFQPVKVSAIAA